MKHLKLFMALLALIGVNLTAGAQTWTGNEVQDGTFFLYNVGAQKYLNNGDPSQDWGSNAYLQKGFGLDATLAKISDGVYTIDTKVSNGGNSHYLATSTWCDGNATNWTFTPIAEGATVYTISNGENFLVANEAGDDVVYGALSSVEANNQWMLVSLDDFKNAMKNMAFSSTEPMDVSVFIQGRSFARNDTRNNTWEKTSNGGTFRFVEAQGTNNHYQGNEAWNCTFDIHQAIADLPDGTYEVQCSGFGTNGTTYVYGNNASGALTTDNGAANGDRAVAYRLITDENAWAGQSSGKFNISDGNLTLGLKREKVVSYDWCVFDEFRLYYYGLDLSEFAASLAEAVSAAEAVEGTVPAAVYEVLASVVADNNKSYTTAAEYTTATNAIIDATNTAKALQTDFARYLSVKNAALAINSNLDIATADATANAATTVAEIETAVAAVRQALLAYIPTAEIAEGDYIDLTNAIVDNPTVSENTNYWTAEGTPNTNYSWAAVNYGETEFYQQNFDFYQTITGLPIGTYQFGVTGFHRAGNHATYFYAGDDKILIPGVESSAVNSMAQAKEYFDAGNGKVDLKFALEGESNDIKIGIVNNDTQTDKWTIFRNFTLYYYGSQVDLSIYENAWDEAVAAAQAAIEANPNITGEELTTLNAAIADVPEQTKESYTTKTNALIEATQTFVAAADSYNAYANKKAEIDAFADLPYADPDKKPTIADAEDATSADDAVEKANDLVQKLRAYVESNALAEGVEGATDLTSKIKQDAIADWTAEITGSNAKFVLKNADGNDADTYTAADGTKGKNLIDSGDLWGAASWTAKMTQTITLTAGKYVLTAAARGSNDLSTFKLLVDDESVDMGHTGAAVGNGVFDRGFNDYYVEFEVTDYSKDVTIGFEAATGIEHNWCSVARFRLAQIEDNVEWATEEELNAYIDALQAKTLGFEEGEYAPYVNAENIQALQNISSTVDAVFASSFDGNHVPKQTLESAIEEINALEWTANTEEVNGIYDGDFAIQTVPSENTRPIGWQRHSVTANSQDGTDGGYETRLVNVPEGATSTNKGMMTKFHAFYGDQVGYTLPLKAKTTYVLSFKYAGYNDKPILHVNVYDADGTKVANSGDITSIDNNGHNSADSWTNYSYVFTTGENDGNYVIGLIKNSGGTQQKQAAFGDITLFKAKPETVTIKAGRQYTAFSSAMPLDFTDTGLKAEIVVSETGQTQEVTKVPANTGVIVGLAAPATELTEISVPVCAGETDDVTANKLVAVVESATVQQIDGDNTNYVFGKKNGKEAFYKVVAAGMTVPAHNAYLAIPTAAGAKEVIFLGGETTGVSHVDADAVEGDIYTVSGVKVQKAQKGVYIMNGKKLIVK